MLPILLGQRLIIYLLGGALIFGGVSMNELLQKYNGMIHHKNELHININEKVIQELVKDFEKTAKYHIENLIDDGEIEQELTKETLEEVYDEYLEYNYAPAAINRLNITHNNLEYMKKQLPKEDRDLLDWEKKTNKDEEAINESIIRQIIKIKFLDK